MPRAASLLALGLAIGCQPSPESPLPVRALHGQAQTIYRLRLAVRESDLVAATLNRRWMQAEGQWNRCEAQGSNTW